MNRRTFLRGASLLMAPALVRASSLDYVPRGAILDGVPAVPMVGHVCGQSRGGRLYAFWISDGHPYHGMFNPGVMHMMPVPNAVVRDWPADPPA